MTSQALELAPVATIVPAVALSRLGHLMQEAAACHPRAMAVIYRPWTGPPWPEFIDDLPSWSACMPHICDGGPDGKPVRPALRDSDVTDLTDRWLEGCGATEWQKEQWSLERAESRGYGPMSGYLTAPLEPLPVQEDPSPVTAELDLGDHPTESMTRFLEAHESQPADEFEDEQ